MEYIFGYKRILIAFYAINLLIMIFCWFKGCGDLYSVRTEERLGIWLSTIICLFFHYNNLNRMKKVQLRPNPLFIEYLLSLCRLLMIFSMLILFLGLPFVMMYSPVFFVVWKPLLDLFIFEGHLFSPLYYFVILFFLIIFEVIYFFEIKDLDNKLFPEND